MNNSIRHISSKYITLNLCFLLIILFTIAGCSGFSHVKLATKITADRIADKFKKDRFKKKIGIGNFENRTVFIGHDVGNSIQKNIVKVIAKECPDIILETAGDTGLAKSFKVSSKNSFRGIDNLGLARSGRELGMNAIVTGGLMDVREKQEERGLFWFKDVHDFVEIVIAVEVYDTETGAKLLDESYLYESEIDMSEVELIRENRAVEIPSVNKAVLRATKILGEKICLSVLKAKWKGFIRSMSDNKIILASGSDVGLKSGDILEVNDNRKLINGVDGEKFYLPGHKKGEIRLTAVFSDRSEAVAITDNGIRTGYSVQLKK